MDFPLPDLDLIFSAEVESLEVSILMTPNASCQKQLLRDPIRTATFLQMLSVSVSDVDIEPFPRKLITLEKQWR